ncbi:hypothetical protein TcBrA4_0043180 [Trypanosoma cruzi]|nr:hypothetical protein TcBrA4_0043180 [Trypanosoma cruzi]
MPRGMEAPRPCSLGSAVLRYSWDRVCALSWQQENLLVRHTVRVARAAIPSAVCTLCACVSPGGCDMDGSFTPYALEFTIRHCLPGVAPGPGGVSSAFLRRLASAARSSHGKMINTSLADGSLRISCETGTPLPSANTGRTHAARRELLTNPAALCPARGERRTGPPPPVSEEAARGLSECECRRGVPRCTVAVPIGISTALDTADDGRVLAVLGGLLCLGRRAQRW